MHSKALQQLRQYNYADATYFLCQHLELTRYNGLVVIGDKWHLSALVSTNTCPTMKANNQLLTETRG